MGSTSLQLGRRGGFTLVDTLTSMAIVVTLLAIMAPFLSGARETARRVVCSSNIRQIGLGLAMYYQGNRDHFPDSVNAAKFVVVNSPGTPQAMMKLRINNFQDWDGLGLLYSGEYLDARGVFYCPSHHGNYPQSSFTEAWNSGFGSIVSNYHYRGELYVPGATPATVRSEALVADGMATRADFNHTVGCNVLRKDLSCVWYADTDRSLYMSLSETLIPDGRADAGIPRAWNELDGLER